MIAVEAADDDAQYVCHVENSDGKQLYRSRVARSAVVPERSLRSSGSPYGPRRVTTSAARSM